MSTILRIAWDRFNLIALIIGDVQGRVIVVTFYFTILMPFALIARFTTDPLHAKHGTTPTWNKRPAVPTDIDSARQQG